MYKIKTEDVYEDFSRDKEMFDFSNYSSKSKYYDDSNKLVSGKMKDLTGDVAVEELVNESISAYYEQLADIMHNQLYMKWEIIQKAEATPVLKHNHILNIKKQPQFK